MKKIKNLYKILFLLLIISACTDELRDFSFLDTIQPPSNVAALYDITQDNTGLVTITPTADGAETIQVLFGDGTGEFESLVNGESVDRIYAEGTYTIKVVAYNANGDTAEITQQLIVSFQAPQNLVVVVENDLAVSKQVNVTANADFATMFDFYTGETGNTTPISGNIGSTISYVYPEAGTYSIKVVAKGAAIETTEYTADFEVTEILVPINSAANPPNRNETDVISIFSDAYENVAGTDLNPNWGQGTTYTAFDLNGNNIIQYSNLNYQGIDIGSSVDASSMEFLHIDIWTTDATSIDIYPLPNGVAPADERFVTKELIADQWNRFDIPLSEFTDQTLTINDLKQFKFVGAGTVFIDNIYFYKVPSGVVTSTIQDFEGTPPAFTVFGNIAGVEVVANPDQTGSNTTANVAQLTKTAGAEVWAGAFFGTSPLDFTNYSKISVKTWSPKVGAQIKLKLENADASIVHEVDLNSTIANEWEELVYDFSDAPVADYVNVVIFFDFGNAGDDSVYYYDELGLTN